MPYYTSNFRRQDEITFVTPNWAIAWASIVVFCSLLRARRYFHATHVDAALIYLFIFFIVFRNPRCKYESRLIQFHAYLCALKCSNLIIDLAIIVHTSEQVNKYFVNGLYRKKRWWPLSPVSSTTPARHLSIKSSARVHLGRSRYIIVGYLHAILSILNRSPVRRRPGYFGFFLI